MCVSVSVRGREGEGINMSEALCGTCFALRI